MCAAAAKVFTAGLNTNYPGCAAGHCCSQSAPNRRVAISTPTGGNVATGEGIYDLILRAKLTNFPTLTSNVQNVVQIRVYNCDVANLVSQNFGTLNYNVANVAVTRPFVTY